VLTIWKTGENRNLFSAQYLGDFFLKIPFEYQQIKQRWKVFKEGYKTKDITSPVQAGEIVRLVLEKQ